MMRTLLTFVLLLFFSTILTSQLFIDKEKAEGSVDPTLVDIEKDLSIYINEDYYDTRGINSTPAYESIPFQVEDENGISIVSRDAYGNPTFLRGKISSVAQDGNLANRAVAVKEHLRKLNIPNYTIPSQSDLQHVNTNTAHGESHVKYQQYIDDVPVYGGEIIVHKDQEGIYAINGRTYNKVKSGNKVYSADQAIDVAYNDLGESRISNGSQFKLDDEARLVYYSYKGQELQLCWEVNIYPEVHEAWKYFVNASDGKVIEHFNTICHTSIKDGPATTTAEDLNGDTRTLETYESGGLYYLLDASREMYQGAGDIPNDPKNVIWTLNANNSFPGNSDFSISQLTTSDNNWSGRTAVSTHFNAAEAYEYYRNTFERNSINDNGGNIISFINVSDENGGDLDNAFWNGKAMFYGNGDQQFTELAGALDVAGHELTHGVIQSTANLEYKNESGAVNESMADVFGVMIDREDYKLGEDVVTSFFPSGALRDMANPNNGGSQLGDPGYQPDHYNERYLGNQDNGGVHINSGIPNHAFYLFAEAVGKDKAEQVYYHALSNYLGLKSDFSDLRASIEQSCLDLYSEAEKNEASTAFAAVGIGDDGNTGGGVSTYTPNPGRDWIYTVNSNGYLTLVDGNGNVAGTLSQSEQVKSKPSVTDDGRVVVYVNQSDEIYVHILNFEGQEPTIVDEGVVEGTQEWGNVAISKDGSKIAFVSIYSDKTIFLYDFESQETQVFELYNPTFTEGLKSGSVLYADALEFDHTGNYVIYDAYNEIESEFGETLNYWDVAFMEVTNGDQWASGDITSLFGSLPEGISVGNPSLAKNRSDLIAVDILDDTGANSVLQLGMVSLSDNQVYTFGTNSVLSYPGFSRLDDKLIFSAESSGNPVIATAVLNNDNTGFAESPEYFVDGEKGVWFADGQRSLNNDNADLKSKLKISPNPVENMMKVEFEYAHITDCQLHIFSSSGKLIKRIEVNSGLKSSNISTEKLSPGVYFLHLSTPDGIGVKKFIKQ